MICAGWIDAVFICNDLWQLRSLWNSTLRQSWDIMRSLRHHFKSMQWLQLTRTRDTHHVHYRSLGLVMQEQRLGSWITHAESMQWALHKVAMLYEEFLAYRDICCISTLYSHKSNNHAKNTIFIKTYVCVCVHSLRTPAIRISRIESIEWSVLQCSMSPSPKQYPWFWVFPSFRYFP